VLDLGSTNGTNVNGQRGAERVALQHGAAVTAGTVEVRVSVESEQPAARDEDPAELRTWRNFPGLEMLRELGTGSMGKVFLVRLTASGTQAVLKTAALSSALGAERGALYFQREMEATKALRHPNIVAFIDGGRFEGKLYFLLEYCGGGSVQDLIAARGGRLPPAEAGPLMLQALEGIEFAHARGVIHRDLKPANLLLTEEGGATVLKIADFGLAKNFKLAGMSGVTEVGMTAGSLSFAPREQITNFRFAQPSTDIFSLGAAFYMMLSGESVYDFVTGREPLEAVLEGRTVPLRTRVPGLPEALCAVIDQATAVEPSARPASAAAFRAALQELVGS
jgi:serine/threonine protein kinase